MEKVNKKVLIAVCKVIQITLFIEFYVKEKHPKYTTIFGLVGLCINAKSKIWMFVVLYGNKNEQQIYYK